MGKTNKIKEILIKMKKAMEEKNIKSLSLFDYTLNQDVDIKGELIEWGNCSYNEKQNILTITFNGDYETIETLIEDMRKDLEEIKKIADKKEWYEVEDEINEEINKLEEEINKLEGKKEKLEYKWDYAHKNNINNN